MDTKKPLSSGLLRLKLFFALAAVAAIMSIIASWALVKIHNTESDLDLIYDSSTCGVVGSSREDVENCFKSRGYKPHPYGLTSESYASGTAMTTGFRAAIAEYSSDGRLIRISLNATLPPP